jgi:hypothetical protein
MYLQLSSATMTVPLTALKNTNAPLFLRKLVLGIRAQASNKSDVAINAYGTSVRPAFALHS